MRDRPYVGGSPGTDAPRSRTGTDDAASRLREHSIGATRRDVSIDADTEAALRWLRERRVCTASRLLRDAAREELGRQDGTLFTHGVDSFAPASRF